MRLYSKLVRGVEVVGIAIGGQIRSALYKLGHSVTVCVAF